MRIVVVGGSGLIGSRLVGLLTTAGHEAVPRSRSTGVDLVTGRGLPEALAGADVVVDLTKPPAFDDSSPGFFRATMGHLLAAASSAGVGHAVILSIVGADQVPGLAYYRAKVLQEDLLKAGPVPYSIVRSTQFFEFVATVLSWTSDESTVRLPATLLQPVAGDDVARVVAGVVVGTPLRGTLDVAGPEVFPLDELGRITLAARTRPPVTASRRTW
ncbi:NmrA-like family protein [Nonomuraea coxensis DSM 45129]|uniref:NmrA-like family protein n=1 Tax=Nonomuraea coxensis DSM 45129 TaxID=1122611 RepID=A0ABX8TZZ2_9ACTN|nr:NAD(P)H-binding protein [Nonomuraea coxensis]QYC40954.1 NmrA-like family protein [Nonomuraea coxensis DSM 45129]